MAVIFRYELSFLLSHWKSYEWRDICSFLLRSSSRDIFLTGLCIFWYFADFASLIIPSIMSIRASERFAQIVEVFDDRVGILKNSIIWKKNRYFSNNSHVILHVQFSCETLSLSQIDLTYVKSYPYNLVSLRTVMDVKHASCQYQQYLRQHLVKWTKATASAFAILVRELPKFWKNRHIREASLNYSHNTHFINEAWSENVRDVYGRLKIFF
jgi:hypothetical protein